MVKQVTTEEVEKLARNGAQIVDVLPAKSYTEEHLPGAINIPMAEIASASERLDLDKPVVLYCHDHQCDLSSRAAARLDAMGFHEVYDYVDSKVAWFAEGLPSEGLVDDTKRAIARVRPDVPTLPTEATLRDVASVDGDWEVIAVTSGEDVVLGVVRPEAKGVAPDTAVTAVMQPAPSTVRPSIPLRELAESMDKNGERFVLVTTHEGKLLGLVRRDELDAA